MIIQYASDLHLEFVKNRDYMRRQPLLPKGDVLVLAGDIVGNFDIYNNGMRDLMDFCTDNFEATYWVPGNHEYYGFDIATQCGVINEAIRSNVFLVNNIAIERADVRFVFSTMWTAISEEQSWLVAKRLSDYHAIKYGDKLLTVEDYNALHRYCLAFIKGALAVPFDGATVVVTHHVPTYMHYPEQYRGDGLNEAFAVELHDYIYGLGMDEGGGMRYERGGMSDELGGMRYEGGGMSDEGGGMRYERGGMSDEGGGMSDYVRGEKIFCPYWIYGHHHKNVAAFEIGKTKMLTNQLGYVSYGEQKLFNREATVEL